VTFIFWLQFVTVCVAGAMSPGPSLALIVRNSITINRFAGFMTSIGHGLGMGVYAVFAVTGLSIILTANQLLFQLIQIIGIIFLLYLGFQFIFKKNTEIDKINEQKSINSFLQGFSIAIFNPKILIWFSAVFSQFVKIDASFFSHSILVVTASVIDGIWYIIVSIVVTSYGMSDFFQKREGIIQKISGLILVLIGALLIIDFF